MNTAIPRMAVRCAQMGLRPIVGWTRGTQFRPAVKYANGLGTDDVGEAQRMLKHHPGADRLGLIMGPCRAGNLFVIDLDRNHGDGADGVFALRRWLDAHDVTDLPAGPRWRTPRGGLQLLFRAPPGARVRHMCGDHALAPGVDVKGYNGLATIPPTKREDGCYAWCDGLSLFDSPIPAAPSELVAAVRAKPPATPPATIAPRVVDHRSADRRRYIERAIDDEIEMLASCAEGGRNTQLFRTAAVASGFHAGEPGLVNIDVVVARLHAACAANGLQKQDGAQAVSATIRSGLRRGREAPRRAPPRT